MIHRHRPKSKRGPALLNVNSPHADAALRAIWAGLVCACGATAHFGEGVSIRAGQIGTWRCHACWRAAEAYRP